MLAAVQADSTTAEQMLPEKIGSSCSGWGTVADLGTAVDLRNLADNLAELELALAMGCSNWLQAALHTANMEGARHRPSKIPAKAFCQVSVAIACLLDLARLGAREV